MPCGANSETTYRGKHSTNHNGAHNPPFLNHFSASQPESKFIHCSVCCIVISDTLFWQQSDVFTPFIMLNPPLLLARICSIIQGLRKFGCSRANNNGMACRVCVSLSKLSLRNVEGRTPPIFEINHLWEMWLQQCHTTCNQFNQFIHLALHAVTLWAS